MDDRIDHILFGEGDALNPDADPDMRTESRAWASMCSEVARNWSAGMPERELLVLKALDSSGRSDVLSDDEAERLEAASPRIDAWIARTESGQAIVNRIAEEANLFEAVWDGKPSRADRAPVRSKALVWGSRIAASVAVLLFVSLLAYLSNRSTGIFYQTAADETLAITLSDGSSVYLSENSTLTADRFSEHAERHVSLVGSAFFDVASSSQGFSVGTRGAEVSVLGTSFGITESVNAVDVVLVEGRVELLPFGSKPIVMRPGQLVRIADGGMITTSEQVDLGIALEWTGMFLFRSTPVEQVAEILGRHGGRIVRIDESVRGETFSGSFSRTEDAREIIDILALAAGATVTPDESGNLVLSR